MLLDVQLLGFQNENNLVIRATNNGSMVYCCCHSGSLCSKDKNHNQISSCPESCDVFFNANLSECQSPTGCFISTMNAPIEDSPTSSSAYRFSFIINNISPQVSPYESICLARFLMYHTCTVPHVLSSALISLFSPKCSILGTVEH